MMRPLVLRMSSLSVVAVSNLIAIPLLLLLAWPSFTTQDWGAIQPTAWIQAAASGLLSISLAYVVWSKGVQRLGGAHTAVYANLIPVVAALTGVLFLGERLTALQIVGAACVLVGSQPLTIRPPACYNPPTSNLT